MRKILSADKLCILYNLLLNFIYSFGKNKKNLPKTKSFIQLLLKQFEDTILRVLLVAATLTFIIGIFSEESYQWVEGASIYFACGFIALFSSACDLLKEKQF